MTAAHSVLGASSMHRWSACPGSVRLIATVPARAGSRYAEEGTDAHAYAAWCLDAGKRPHESHKTQKAISDRAFAITDELIEAVAVYYDYAMDAQDDGDKLLIEQRFDLSSVHPGCFGTADAVIWKPAEKLLIVVDYKHGAGIMVSPENNPQLMYYALGALIHSKLPAERVRMAIVQPRGNGDPIKEWEIDALDLLDFRMELKRYAVATEIRDAPLSPGDHCRFCPAAAVCPAIKDRANALAKQVFAPATAYDPEKLKLALDSREYLKAWLKSLDEFAYAEAEAGRCPPGYKLVDKRATRKWRDEGDTIEALQKAGMKDDVIFEPRSLKSPTQMEKVVAPAKLVEYIVKESSGHVLAPESDKRPAIKLAATEVFTPINVDLVTDCPTFLRRAPQPASETA